MKLLYLENSKHSSHVSVIFTSSTIQHLEDKAGFLGSEEVTFNSLGNKSKIPSRLTALHTQASLVMHIEYKVKISNHDIIIAKQHKLVPSVVGDMKVKAKPLSFDAVTYSGPIYMVVQSAKHLGSIAYQHLIDMECVPLVLKISLKYSKNEGKLVMVISVDEMKTLSMKKEFLVLSIILTMMTWMQFSF